MQEDEMGREIAGLRKKYADFDEYVSFIEKRNSDLLYACLQLMHECASAKKFKRMQYILLSFVGSEDLISSKKRFEVFYELFSGPGTLVSKDYFYEPKGHDGKSLKLFHEVETSASSSAFTYIVEMNAAQARCLILVKENASPEEYKRMLQISEEVTPSFARVK